MNRRLLLPALLLLASASAFAQAPAAAPVAADEPAAQADASIDRHCLRNTGTHLRARTSAGRVRCSSLGFGRVYTQDDLRSTGAVDMGQALRMLDPAVR